eukprot:TRINITY_DN1991_c0_g1_i1.p1 TRINITY_DN1991_c0_g1~~TRINITY_DN1991_c0_g1_i1.p1  ORF type:complete len:288 (+),score=78.31 TRINITY_DN1991_c0_g1_i1:51-914(+)
MSEKEILKNRWQKLFTESLECDTWGQVVEAVDGYKSLATQIGKSVEKLTLSAAERDVLSKLILALNIRSKSLQDKAFQGVSLEQMKLIPPLFPSLFKPNNEYYFPINMNTFQTVAVSDETISSVAGRSSSTEQGGSLLPPAPLSPHQIGVTIHISKIGLKDATQYLDPFITISVMNSNGSLVEPAQDTPVSNRKNELCVNYGLNVNLQTPLANLPSTSAVFFEFKHFKPKKQKISTKAWAFMEMDELKPGPVVLEIYQKPTDPKRKSLRLLSVKPLYLHLNVTFHKA